VTATGAPADGGAEPVAGPVSPIGRLGLDEMAPRLAEALGPRVKRLGYLGDVFAYGAHQPDALLAFMDFTEASKAPLPDDLVELVALTVATRLSNDYERNQHERLSVRLGFGRDWVAAVEAAARSAAAVTVDDPLLTGAQRVVQSYVLAALADNGRGSERALQTVARELGAEAAIAVLMVVGRYVVHGLMVHSLGLAPPVPSIFEDGFDGR
jgi:hypothetical protein